MADTPQVVKHEPAKIPLSQPIQAHGKEVRELTLAVPFGVHIRRCGAPYKFEYLDGARQPIMIVDTAAVARYVEELAGIPPSSVNRISAPDFNKCQAAVLGFFSEEIEETLKQGS